MPSETTVADIADAYFWGWELGLKAIAIYRDGSKQSQPLSTKSESQKAADKEAESKVEKIVYKPLRERLPDTRQSITHKYNISGHEGYINVGLYPDGRPGEVFITMAKEGSTIGGLMDSFGTAISIALQYGVPLEVLVNKFSHTRFEPNGHTSNPDIRIAKSIVDYIFRWLGITFLEGFREANVPSAKTDETSNEQVRRPSTPNVDGNGGELPRAIAFAPILSSAKLSSNGSHNGAKADASRAAPRNRDGQFALFQSDAPSCDNCGAITVRNGNCYLCHNCGNSLGCS
jgi:ribonucleoside-diphosphate reductase alpha chain